MKWLDWITWYVLVSYCLKKKKIFKRMNALKKNIKYSVILSNASFLSKEVTMG